MPHEGVDGGYRRVGGAPAAIVYDVNIDRVGGEYAPPRVVEDG